MTDDRSEMQANRAAGLAKRHERRLAQLDDRLYEKFRVERTDPEAQERHKDCWMFVLDPEHDPIARVALKAYADAAAEGGKFDLAGDLRLKVLENGWLL